jgi:hypothetical protein
MDAEEAPTWQGLALRITASCWCADSSSKSSVKQTLTALPSTGVLQTSCEQSGQAKLAVTL